MRIPHKPLHGAVRNVLVQLNVGQSKEVKIRPVNARIGRIGPDRTADFQFRYDIDEQRNSALSCKIGHDHCNATALAGKVIAGKHNPDRVDVVRLHCVLRLWNHNIR